MAGEGDEDDDGIEVAQAPAEAQANTESKGECRICLRQGDVCVKEECSKCNKIDSRIHERAHYILCCDPCVDAHEDRVKGYNIT